MFRSLRGRVDHSARSAARRRGAGIFGVLTPLVVADLTRGTGQYNLALGAVAPAHGVGASLSGLAAGLIVDHSGHSAAFLTASGVASLAFALLLAAMPETAGDLAAADARVGSPARPQRADAASL